MFLHNTYEVKKIADYMTIVINCASIDVAGEPIRASVETAPKRRERVRLWFLARDHLSQLNPHKGLCRLRAGPRDLEQAGDKAHLLQGCDGGRMGMEVRRTP